MVFKTLTYKTQTKHSHKKRKQKTTTPLAQHSEYLERSHPLIQASEFPGCLAVIKPILTYQILSCCKKSVMTCTVVVDREGYTGCTGYRHLLDRTCAVVVEWEACVRGAKLGATSQANSNQNPVKLVATSNQVPVKLSAIRTWSNV